MGSRRWKEDRRPDSVFLADWRLEAALLTLVPLSLTPDLRSAPAASLESTPNKVVGLIPETSVLWVWFQSLHKIFHFDGLKGFAVSGRLSWRLLFNWAAVTFPSLCAQIQKVDEEVKVLWSVTQMTGLHLSREDRSADFYLAASSVLSAGSTAGCACLWVAAHNLDIWETLGLEPLIVSVKRRSGWQNNVSLSVHSWDIM